MPLAAALLAVVLVSAGPSRASTPGDPFEGINRKMFAIQEGLDKHLFGPLSRGYGATPSGLRLVLSNWAHNLDEPVIFANDVLQGHFATAARTLTRLVINSTFGVAGFLDVAKKNGLPRHDNSFGTTLGRWGVGPGAYVFVPLLGPTTVRDGLGRLGDLGLNPLTYARFEGRTEIGIAGTVINGLSERVDSENDLAHIRDTSTDPYATLRSYFLQNREAEIRGKEVDINALPDLDSGAPAAPAAPLEPKPSETKPDAPAPSTEAAAAPIEDLTPDPSLGEDPSE